MRPGTHPPPQPPVILRELFSIYVGLTQIKIGAGMPINPRTTVLIAYELVPFYLDLLIFV